MICQEIKCPEYDTSDGEPAWCNRAGCPAIVAVKKCPEVMGKPIGENDESKTGKHNKNS